MEQPQYLIDSNSVIDFLSKKLPERGIIFMNNVIDDLPNISVITKIEVLGFDAQPKDSALLNDFVGDSNVIELTKSIVDKCIELRRKNKTKLPDAIIAATALELGLTLITRNIGDFKNIPNLKSINPWDL
jgi:predicted nucleic acid-binding protein